MFGRQRLICWLPSTSIFRKMLRCKSQFTKYAKIYISTLFTPQYKLLNKISMVIPNLINLCIQRLYILHQGCLLQGHPALDKFSELHIFSWAVDTGQLLNLCNNCLIYVTLCHFMLLNLMWTLFKINKTSHFRSCYP